jgi:hypothetical protein
MNTRRRQYVVTALAAAVGLALFSYAVRTAGVDEIVAGVRRVGWGLVIILALAGARFILRAECWRLCMPSPVRLSRWRAFTAFLAGDSVGSVTPLGLLASEPTKVLLTRHRLPTRASVSSLAAENLVYAASVLAVVVVGLLTLLAVAPPGRSWWLSIIVALSALVAGAVLVGWIVRGTWDPGRGARPPWRARLAALREEVLALGAGRGVRLEWVFGLDLAFHALAVAEVYLTLDWLLGDLSPSIAQAIVFEALNRVVTVAFKFVPFRIGVDEATSGALAPVLALDPATGVALAVLRKARNLVWAGVGLTFVAWLPGATPAGMELDGRGESPDV